MLIFWVLKIDGKKDRNHPEIEWFLSFFIIGKRIG